MLDHGRHSGRYTFAYQIEVRRSDVDAAMDGAAASGRVLRARRAAPRIPHGAAVQPALAGTRHLQESRARCKLSQGLSHSLRKVSGGTVDTALSAAQSTHQAFLTLKTEITANGPFTSGFSRLALRLRVAGKERGFHLQPFLNVRLTLTMPANGIGVQSNQSLFVYVNGHTLRCTCMLTGSASKLHWSGVRPTGSRCRNFHSGRL